MNKTISRLLCSAGFMVMTAATSATAQTAANYPSKPVRIILPYAPGGGTSTDTRIFADKLGKDMGQNFLVDNRPGGNTIVGTMAVVRAAPDGYTLLLTTSTLALNQWTQPELPYDTLKDLFGAATFTTNENMIAVHSSVPAGTLKELIGYAKQNPEKIITRLQPGTTSEITLRWLMNATDTKLTLVPYKGSGAAQNDLLAGRLNFIMTTPSNIIPLVKTGKLIPLAISGPRRLPTLPDIPTFDEQGLHGFVAANWHMLLVPSATPRDIVEKLNDFVGKAQNSSEVRDQLAKVGLDPMPNSVASTNALLRSQIESFGKLVKQYNIKAGEE